MNVTTMQRRRFYVGIPMNVFGNINALMVQRHIFYADIPMDVFAMVNVVTTQRCRYYTIIPIDVFYNIHALMVQLGTSCSFDSPGLARNEPTPGQRSQGIQRRRC